MEQKYMEERIRELGLIPVAAFACAEDAPQAAHALAAGGIPVLEVTLRTEAGLRAIERVRSECRDILVGAGTVLTIQQARDAAAAGAMFIVSPGLQRDVCTWCMEQGIAVFPGCVTPSEIQQGLALGLHTFKFFPASVYGGLRACKALYGPFQPAGVSFIPTGGIDLSNLAEYARAPFVAAVGGGWLCDNAAIRAGDFEQLTLTARRSVEALLGFSFAHVGVNPGGRPLKELEQLLASYEGEASSCFMMHGAIECCPELAPGTHGHLAIATNDVLRAARFLEKRGACFDWENAKWAGSRLNALYMTEEFGGFAVHLLQKKN